MAVYLLLSYKLSWTWTLGFGGGITGGGSGLVLGLGLFGGGSGLVLELEMPKR